MSGGGSYRCLIGASIVALTQAKFSPSIVASQGWNAWTHPGRWLERVMQDKPDAYIINFGAHLNLNAPRTMYFDPVSVWQRKKSARGLAVDADDDMKWTGPGIARRTTFIEPAGVAALLNETRTPPKPRLLKVDIDSFDAVVVIAVLEVRSPDFVYVEINERAPPPTCYCNDNVKAVEAQKESIRSAVGSNCALNCKSTTVKAAADGDDSSAAATGGSASDSSESNNYNAGTGSNNRAASKDYFKVTSGVSFFFFFCFESRPVEYYFFLTISNKVNLFSSYLFFSSLAQSPLTVNVSKVQLEVVRILNVPLK